MNIEEFIREWNGEQKTLLVHTSGSTGKPKPLQVEKHRMLASARMTCDFLSLHEGDSALLCLPLDFIAGKMMVVRSLERGLDLTVVEPSNHPLQGQKHDFDLVAMVPSQVHCSMQVPEERECLRSIRNLIIGGGSIPEEMEQELRDFPNAVWSTYGMTETLSHIALRRINGTEASGWYTPFEGVRISLQDEDEDEEGRGQLIIDAPYVVAEPLITNDIAELNPRDNSFRIIGRKDNVICSGGIKLHIEEIEKSLSPHLDSSFCISSRKDDKFGEVAVLIIDDTLCKVSDDSIMDICARVLKKYSIPRRIIRANIPLTKTGKIDRAKAKQI